MGRPEAGFSREGILYPFPAQLRFRPRWRRHSRGSPNGKKKITWCALQFAEAGSSQGGVLLEALSHTAAWGVLPAVLRPLPEPGARGAAARQGWGLREPGEECPGAWRENPFSLQGLSRVPY